MQQSPPCCKILINVYQNFKVNFESSCGSPGEGGAVLRGGPPAAELPARLRGRSLRLLPRNPLRAGDLAGGPLQPRAQPRQRIRHRPNPPRLHHRYCLTLPSWMHRCKSNKIYGLD